MIILCRATKGSTLEAATAEALALAKRNQSDVEFDYEGRQVRVSHTDTPQKANARASAALTIRRGLT